MTKEDRKNAYLYCKFRDEQFAFYDEYAKRHGLLMKTFLVVNALFYDAVYSGGGMTQAELAEQVGVGTAFVSRVERGQKRMRLETMLAFADALHISAGLLFVLRHCRAF